MLGYGASCALRAPAAPNPPYELRAAELTGRPLGADGFVTRLETLVQRRPRRRKPDERPRRRRIPVIFSSEWAAGQRSPVLCKVSP
jgi:hypothetical protein